MGLTTNIVMWILLFLLAEAQGGRDFVVSFLRSAGSGNHGALFIINQGPEEAVVNVRTPRLTSGQTSVNATLRLPPGVSEKINIQHVTSLAKEFPFIEDKGILVTSTGDIAVYGMTVGDFTADAFSVPPTDQLGTQYLVASYKYSQATIPQGPYQLAVTAFLDDTDVTISLSEDMGLSVSLQAFQTFLFTLPYEAPLELTGARIHSSLPVFAMSGAAVSSVGAPLYLDQLLDSLPPVSTLGLTYLVVAFKGRTVGDIVRIIGLETDTAINAKGPGYGNSSLTVGPFVYHDIELPSDSVLEITASRPIQVVQFMQSTWLEESNAGDCSMAAVLPPGAWASVYYFTTLTDFSSVDYVNYVNVIVNTSSETGVYLDDVTIDAWLPLGESDFSYTRISLEPGYHVLRHRDEVVFGAMLYGHAHMESYAMSLTDQGAADVATTSPTLMTTSTNLMTSEFDPTRPEPTMSVTPFTSMYQSSSSSVKSTTTSSTTNEHVTVVDVTSSTMPMGGSPTSAAVTSRQNTAEQSSLISCTCPDEILWLPWTTWSDCSSTCGKGVRHRKRGCQGNKACGHGDVSHEECDEKDCPYVRMKVLPRKPFHYIDWKDADSRESAKGVSSIVIATLITIWLLIVISDVPTIVKTIRGRKQERRMKRVTKANSVEPLIERTRL